MAKQSESERRAPPRMSLNGVKKYLNAFEAPNVINRRLIVLLAAVSTIALIEAFSIKAMLPLKQYIPYFVNVEPGGAVTDSNQVAKEFSPDENTKRWFLSQWAQDMLTVDDQTKAIRMPRSYSFMRGKAATDEWNRFIWNDYKPLDALSKSPTIRVYATARPVEFISDSAAVIHVELHSNADDTVKHLLVSVRFAIIPPEKDDEVYKNPAGIWILHFEVQSE